MATNEELILLNINGTDRLGVTAKLTEILAQNNANILDIGQADIHNNLSLGILIQTDFAGRLQQMGQYARTQPIYCYYLGTKADGQTNCRRQPNYSGTRYEY